MYMTVMFFNLRMLWTVCKTVSDSKDTQVISREEENIQWYGWLWHFPTLWRNNHDWTFWIEVPWMSLQTHLSPPVKYCWAAFIPNKSCWLKFASTHISEDIFILWPACKYPILNLQVSLLTNSLQLVFDGPSMDYAVPSSVRVLSFFKLPELKELCSNPLTSSSSFWNIMFLI